MLKSLQEDLAYLYALDGRGIRLGLQRIGRLIDVLGAPQRAFKSIHIAGTNGKGSTCAVIAAILQAAGFRVGLYTSPHLIRFNERVQVNGKVIDDAAIQEFIHWMRPIIDEAGATFFEATTALAFWYFQKEAVEYAVIETGLGGRFDATNVLTPELTVITPIGKDHEERLGRTLTRIALEKTGIAKPGVPCVLSRQRPAVLAVMQKDLYQRMAPFYNAPELLYIRLRREDIHYQNLDLQFPSFQLRNVAFPLIGSHQRLNLQTALAAITVLGQITIAPKAISTGIERVYWPGRLQVIREYPLVFYDVGHNYHGIRQVLRTVRRLLPEQPLDVVLATGPRKKLGSLGQQLKVLGGRVYVSELPDFPTTPAPKIADRLARDIPRNRLNVEPNLLLLLNKIYHESRCNRPLLILGSHYLAPVVSRVYKFSFDK
jgi:dihydrofolate synthase/folylpolyglutamate synthase